MIKSYHFHHDFNAAGSFELSIQSSTFFKTSKSYMSSFCFLTISAPLLSLSLSFSLSKHFPQNVEKLLIPHLLVFNTNDLHNLFPLQLKQLSFFYFLHVSYLLTQWSFCLLVLNLSFTRILGEQQQLLVVDSPTQQCSSKFKFYSKLTDKQIDWH